MKRILAGIDGSPGAQRAVTWASRWAATVGAELILVNLLPDGRAGGPAPEAPAIAPAVQVRRIIVEGGGGQGLIQAGETEDVDLVVVGSTGVGWFPAPHPAHVGHYVACHATRPVAVVPFDAGDLPVGRLVVGVDGSPGSKAATYWVAQAPAAFTQEVVVVHATDAPLPAVAAVRDGRPPAQTVIQPSWTEALSAAEVGFSIRDVHADPVVALCQTAGEVPYSTIVLGGRTVDEHHPLRIGSVGLRALDRARGPVIIVPPAL